MAHYQTLLDLKRSTTKANHLISRFHTSSPNGGGWFIWQKGSNAGITEIPGIIVKPVALTDGYWIRQEYLQGIPYTPEMFGAASYQGTMLAQGWTQSDANTVFQGMTVTVGTDTADTVAIQAMFNAMFNVSSTANSDIKACNFSGRDYFLNKACTMPRFPGDTSGTTAPGRMVRFVLEGNGARIRPLTTQNFALFQSEILSDVDNENKQADRNITIQNFTFDGVAGSGGTSYCLKLYGGTNNIIRSCHFKGCDYGLWCGFVINNIIDTCFAQHNSTCGYYIGINGGANSGQSNCTRITMCKSTQQGVNRKGFIIDNSNNVELNGITLEGAHKYGIQLVYTGTTVNTFKASNIHWESLPGSTLLYNERVHQVILDYIESGSPNTVLVESNPSVDVFYYISNIGYPQTGVKFAHRGNPDATSFWFFNNVAAFNNTIKDAANWVTTSGYSVPNFAPVENVNGNTMTRVQRTQVLNNMAGGSTARLWEGYFGILKTANV